MRIAKTILCAAASLGALAIIGAVTAPKISAAIKAAYVELVVPDKAFTQDVEFGSLNGGVVVGPGTGTLGVTSLTVTNYDATLQDVFVFVPQLSLNTPGTCNGFLSGVAGPSFHILVQPYSTIHIAYPSPLVYTPGVGGGTCIGLQGDSPRSGNLNVTINGFVN